MSGECEKRKMRRGHPRSLVKAPETHEKKRMSNYAFKAGKCDTDDSGAPYERDNVCDPSAGNPQG